MNDVKHPFSTETERKTAGWPPYVMADILSRMTGKHVVVRPIEVLNRDNSTNTKLHYEVRYEIGVETACKKQSEKTEFTTLATLDVSYVQYVGKNGYCDVSMPLPYDWHNPLKACDSKNASLQVDAYGNFIGELLPREAMQSMVDATQHMRRAKLADIARSETQQAGRTA